MAFELNYDDAIGLDAEELAEGGIAKAYQRLLPKLRKYVPSPAKIEELRDDDTPSYAVRFRGEEFPIHGPDLDEEEANSWGRATYVLFTIVNEQMVESEYQFYAINGGNDLFGIFLTPEQAIAARESLENHGDWPYIPEDEPPLYGMFD